MSDVFQWGISHNLDIFIETNPLGNIICRKNMDE